MDSQICGRGFNRPMPTLDVNDAFDPSFLDDVTVIRHFPTLTNQGRRVDNQMAFSIRAVVTASSPDDLQYSPEVEFMSKAITVCAQADQYTDRAVLQGPGPGTAADELLWHGSSFRVSSIQDYAGYGRGFIQAVAISTTQPDPPSPIHNTIGTA